MDKLIKITTHCLGAMIFCLGAVQLEAEDEPTSTVPQGEQYILFDPDGGDTLTLTTSEQPTPDCPGDQPDGDPDYIWDYGTLDGDDSIPGTLTVTNDVDGSYDVTVYCSQAFIGADGNDYTEETQPCDPITDSQKPISLTYDSSGNINDPVGNSVKLLLLDKDGKPIVSARLKGGQTDIYLLESLPACKTIFWIGDTSYSYIPHDAVPDGTVAAQDTDSHGFIVDTPISLGTQKELINIIKGDFIKYGHKYDSVTRDIPALAYKIQSGNYTSGVLLTQHQIITATITWNGDTPTIAPNNIQVETVQ